MIKYVLLIIIVGFGISCTSPKEQEVPMMSFKQLDPYLHRNNDTVYVINFWATWCKPCVKEIPGFEKFNRDFKDKKVKVILVNLDFPDKHDELLLPFIKNNNIKSEVIHLTDINSNVWIDKVNTLWSGGIPATLVYKGTSREFHEAPLTYDELKSIVESKM